MRLTHPAGADLETVVVGEIQVARIELGRLAQRMAQDRRLAVIDHGPGGHPAKEAEGIFVATQEQFLALAQGELDVEQAAVTEHAHEEGKPSAGRADGDGAPTAPIHLQAFARGKVQRKKGFDRLGPDQPDILPHDRVAHLESISLEALQDLLGAQVVGLQPTLDAGLVRIELAAAARPPRRMVIVLEPVADGLLVQL